MTNIAAKQKRQRGASPQVLCWTTQFAGARHGMGMPAAVAAEIIDAFQGQGNVIKKRDDVHKMAQANKAFAHYAWGN